MSTFDNPFDPNRRLSRSGCSCGQHGSDGRARTAALTSRCRSGVDRERAKRYEGVVASAVMRAMFPQDVARRAFLKSVGAATARGRGVAILPAEDRDRSVRARRAAGKEGPQGRLHPDHLRHADHHGGADGVLRQERAQRRSHQDRRLGRHSRQDHQQGIRRGPHAVADAARHHHGRRLQSAALHHAGGREHQRPGDHAVGQAQGQAQSEGLEGFQVRRAIRLLDAQLPAALLSRRARHRSRCRRADPRRAAAGNGRQSARRQYRRLPRARSDEPARGL